MASSRLSTRPQSGPDQVPDGSVRRLGRPRSFDLGPAITVALEVFLVRGYGHTTVAELTQAMGISRPSFYAAFGSKAMLFKLALKLHAERHAALLDHALGEPTVRGVAGRLLLGAMVYPMLAGGVGGFAGVLSSFPSDLASQPLRNLILAHRDVVMEALAKRFLDAHRAGDVPATLRPQTLLFLFEALTHGLAVSAAGGMAQRDRLELVLETLKILEVGGLVGSK